MAIKEIFVVGAGFMGSGILQNAAQKGIHAVAYDIAQKSLDRSKQGIIKSLTKRVQKGKITQEEMDATISRIGYTTNIADCKDADFIIEAVSENKDLKISIMKELDKYANPDAIISSNTSSISITSLGSVFKDPSRFVGTHFFSPVPVMPLMEIVRGFQTGEKAKKMAAELGEMMGKTCIHSRDEAGFIINRMLLPMLNEACLVVERRVGTIEEIDTGMKLGLNHPMGPLELMDMIGIDVELAVMEVLYTEIGDPKYRPSQSLRRMVDAGYLGRKTGIGFYIYHEDGTREPNYAMLL
ncbi:MAG: 3-hydroxyacyl-CoA dehydrogenase family protein [Anaerovoracaceae bacterium]|jgi:3-hydroxybutyryl-CoA dehydrogenase